MSVIMFIITALFAHSCSDELDVTVAESTYNEYIRFNATVNNTYAKVQTRSTSSNISSEEDEWLYCSEPTGATRGTPVTSISESVALIGYKIPHNESMDNTQTSWDLMTNQKYILVGDELRAADTPIPWSKVDATESLKVYAYSPYQKSSVTEITGIPTLNVVVDKKIANHSDYIIADTIVKPSEHKKNISLTFCHILTAIRFKAHFKCNVVSITLKNIKNSGTYTYGKGWNVNSSTTDYKVSFGTDGKIVEKDSLITFGDSTMMLIPQTLGEEAEVELVYIPDGKDKAETIRASLKDKVWKQGKMITYTLHDKSQHNIIYFDLAAGNVKITPSLIKGCYWQKNGTGAQILIKYEDYQKAHNKKNIYYVYQTTSANRSTTGLFINGTDSTWVLPKYKEVMWDGKTWSEFITNNDSVEEVIEAWDNAAGTAGAVRTAQRTHTNNRIDIIGSITCNLTIDNIYTRYQEASESRSTGSITYIPTDKSGSTLTINFVGDNRLGAIHYHDANYGTNLPEDNNNRLIFRGTGSLTVADADFYTVTAPGNNNKDDVRGGAGYYSNHWCAAIGNNDNSDDCRGIIINSGTIFAGTTAAENCTAIGGGGNGFGGVTINGGVVTAVATTTGTAIGGGIGFRSGGGVGYVEINGGNIYAYNHANRWNVPSSAIGGAGSKLSKGSQGTVIINGGNIYAQSALGTAIGGGSSYSIQGGDANIKIKGGKVVARSIAAKGGNGGPDEEIGKLLPGGAGIGGGSASTSGASTGGYNGGTATITISGNPIIRTGSIGGGLTFCDNGKIGSADIKIYGGDIQAQFILASGSTGRPSFYMDGGTIRNSNVKDSVYKHVRDYGGAVYLEDGKFEMKNGLIKDCRADKGGAVYIIGDDSTSFKMSGGTIESCIAKSASADGGALYLQGGNVSVYGNANITRNIADGGNGGGICIKQGNFIMKDTARIEFNSSIFEENENVKYGGNGGGVYITSTEAATVDLKSGYITDNTASRKGGGVCIEMPRDDKSATVTIGTDDGIENFNPVLTRNICLTQGGGLYVSGKQSYVTIYDGDITNNTTASYVANDDVANERGMVDLRAGNVTHVNVTFDGNGGTIENDGVTKTTIQKIVTATNSLLVTPKNFIRMGYTFTGWNTRKDGNGVPYTDGQLMNIKDNITLYALWER